MSTQTQTFTAETLVNAILSSPELKASILTVVEQHMQAVTTITPAPVKEVVAPVEQTRPVVKQEATRTNYPSKDGQDYSNLRERDMTVGLLRGTDHYGSFPHAGVFSPNKPRIQKLVLAMAREIAAMYDRGMRTLYVALFPGAELLISDVIKLYAEHNRFQDLEVILMDTPVFADIRAKRRHEAYVFDTMRVNHLASIGKTVQYDRPADMTNACRLLRAGHFLMVSDTTINRHLMEFFKRQRALGAACYYVNPTKFISMVEPDGDGPKGGGAPTPTTPASAKESTPAVSISLDAAMFEGGDTSSPSAASEEQVEEVKFTIPVIESKVPGETPEERLDREIEESTSDEEEAEEEEEERLHFERVAAKKAAQAAPVSGLTFSSDMFASGPIDSVITPSGSQPLVIPDVRGLQKQAAPVEETKPVVKDAGYFYDNMKKALHHSNCRLNVTTQQTKEELILHFKHDEKGDMFNYYVSQVPEGATFHDYVLAKFLDVFAQEDVLTPRTVVEYCLLLARHQSAEVRYLPSHCRTLFMTNPYAMIEAALQTYNVDRVKHKMTIDALHGSLEAVIENLEYFGTCYEPESDFQATSVDGTWA